MTPNLIFLELIHQALRVDGARLVVTVAALEPGDRETRAPMVRTFYDKYRDQLVSHHTHEDRLFFPALAAHVGDSAMHRAELVSEHAQLDHVLERVAKGFAALVNPAREFSVERANVQEAMTAMMGELTSHLDLEEKTALPLVASKMPVAEYKELESKARKATPRGQFGFMVPWIVEHASQDQRHALFRSAPPLRIVYPLNRRRYERLASALQPSG